jgi:hypothetical protein
LPSQFTEPHFPVFPGIHAVFLYFQEDRNAVADNTTTEGFQQKRVHTGFFEAKEKSLTTYRYRNPRCAPYPYQDLRDGLATVLVER